MTRALGIEKNLYNHYTAMELREILGTEEFASMFKFCFVRNPWDNRITSYNVCYTKLLRLHAGQDTQRTFGSSRGTGPLATMAERSDAVAHLLKSDRASDASFRQWLADRLYHLSMRRSELTHELVPEINLPSNERIEIAEKELLSLIKPGETFILVDENEWGSDIAPDRHVIPFLEHEGIYWGVPPSYNFV